MKAAAALAIACMSIACGGPLHRLTVDVERMQRIAHDLDCGDGAPARVLVDLHCRDGICGVSCAPDRWLVTAR